MCITPLLGNGAPGGALLRVLVAQELCRRPLRRAVECGQNMEEKERMRKAADFAYRQAIALCPYQEDGIDHYAAFLTGQKRLRR